MLQIEKIIEAMSQRNAERAVLIGDKATRLFVNGQPLNGQPIPTHQLESLLSEAAPVSIVGQLGNNRLEWVYESQRGNYSVAIARLPDGLRATIAPLQKPKEPLAVERFEEVINTQDSANTSGLGEAVTVPTEIVGKPNVGFLLLPLPWCIAHRAWIGAVTIVLLSFLGGIPGLIYWLILGRRANEVAWQNRRWDSIEHFQRVQKQWLRWGIIIDGGLFVLLLLVIYMTNIRVPS